MYRQAYLGIWFIRHINAKENINAVRFYTAVRLNFKQSSINALFPRLLEGFMIFF